MSVVPASNLNIVSQVFSTSVFKKIVWEGSSKHFLNKIRKFSKRDINFKPSTNGDAIKELYRFLSDNYRFEYLYKNILLNELIESKKLQGTTILNEFKVAKSIADTILINGEPVLYEIKTELDNPEKLLTQITDYQKACAKICIVTHESVYNRYYQLVKDMPVGLSYLAETGNLISLKLPPYFSEKLDHIALFKLLRKEEYSSIVLDKFGYIPDVPNTLFFRACMDLLKTLAVEEFYVLVYKQLKLRVPSELEYIKSARTPKEIKYICYTLNFNASEYQYLQEFLMQPYKS